MPVAEVRGQRLLRCGGTGSARSRARLFSRYRARSSLLRPLKTLFFGTPPLRALDPPVREIEFARGVGVGVDAHEAAEVQGRFVPAPVEIEPPRACVDLDRDAVLGTCRKYLLNVGRRGNCRPVIVRPPAYCWPGLAALTISSDTFARPDIPRARAAAGVRSITRPRTNGPRSFMRTKAARPFSLLVTATTVPNGRLRCAAVRASSRKLSPLAVSAPDDRSYTDACPDRIVFVSCASPIPKLQKTRAIHDDRQIIREMRKRIGQALC
jgi:hypothetical protein